MILDYHMEKVQWLIQVIIHVFKESLKMVYDIKANSHLRMVIIMMVNSTKSRSLTEKEYGNR